MLLSEGDYSMCSMIFLLSLYDDFFNISTWFLCVISTMFLRGLRALIY